MKLWTGRFSKELDSIANDFNSSISFDYRMASQDIAGSIAHATMLEKQKIISKQDFNNIINGLTKILEDLNSGKLEIDMHAEDIHTFIEGELTNRIGEAGKRLHTGRSRNDQVALDIRLYLKTQITDIKSKLVDLIEVLCGKADAFADAVMPGYTHLQRAQPITFGHHLMAYAFMFLRDIDRLNDVAKRMDKSPLGSGALAGTTYDLDREYVAKHLGMSGITYNSMDGVSDRDFCIELAGALCIIMMHLSRFCEEIILWCSWEFQFVELDDAYSTGSSIMPQKKNPDIAELVRGKSGRVYGDLIALLTMMKSLPLAYNKDMQEDKQAIFDATDTVNMCLTAFTPMIDTMKVKTKNMRSAAAKGFINSTDVADYLTKKGMPFRDAYKITGQIVAYCIEQNHTLESLSLQQYQSFSKLFEENIFEEISLENCVAQRKTLGGPNAQSVKKQIEQINMEITQIK